MSSNYPGGFAAGVSIRGIPLTITNPGEVFWVNSSTVLAKGGVGGSDGNKGTYREPFSTITKALTACTASRGDIIMVMPGYTETVSAAAGEVWDVAGVALIGLGAGTLKPTFTFDSSTASDLNVTATNVSVFNFRFVSGIANLAAPLDVTGTYFSVDSCEFMASAAATGMNISLSAAAGAYGISITNSTFNMESSIAGLAVTDVPTEAIRFIHTDNAVINDNFIIGNFSTAAINSITTASEAIQINRNYIYNIGTSAVAGGIDLVAGCTGHVSNNVVFNGEVTTIDTVIDNSSCATCNNHVINVVTEVSDLGGLAST